MLDFGLGWRRFGHAKIIPGLNFALQGSNELSVLKSTELSMKPLALCLLAAFFVVASGRGVGQENTAPGKTAVLFKNARIFDGKELLDGTRDLLVVNNTIAQLSKSPITAPDGATVLDADGRVLMPGMIDAHVHLMLPMTIEEMQKSDDSYIALRAADEAKRMLDRGFTTVRDTGGATFGLKRAIDEGLIKGPRIFPSGAAISQTGGHGDFRKRPGRPRRWDGKLDRFEQLGLMTLADGRDEVLAATRDQLRLGATQIKLMAGGGVASEFDPLDVSQFLEAELQAAVEAATDWGTYVTVRGLARSHSTFWPRVVHP
jgi:imidazolonepropionase-like amidohydrolase